METADSGKTKARQKEKADEARQEVNKKIPPYLRGMVNYLLKEAIKGAELREMVKSELVKIQIFAMRLIFQEIGHRLVGKGMIAEPADIYHCAWSEILSILRGEWDGRGLDILVTERKVRKKAMEELSPPDYVIDEVPHFAEPAAPLQGNVLSGIGVAAGKSTGAARLKGDQSVTVDGDEGKVYL